MFLTWPHMTIDDAVVEFGFVLSIVVPPSIYLCVQDTANVVYIISGRRKSELEDWLGGVPRLVPDVHMFSVLLSLLCIV